MADKPDDTPPAAPAHDKPASKSATVTLAVDGITSDTHRWAKGEDPITVEGTNVPADKAEEIIAQAAAGGVRIREVN